MVVEAARLHFPQLAAGYADPRTRLVIADIADYLRDTVISRSLVYFAFLCLIVLP